MKNKTIYKTNSLDEATWFVVNGLRFDAHYIDRNASEFTFIDDAKLEGLRKKFWSMNININYKDWFTARQSIKYILKAKHMSPKGSSIPTHHDNNLGIVWMPKNGDTYWYVEKMVSGEVNIKSMLFGKGTMHLQKMQSGNFYRSYEDAKLAADLIKK